MGAVNALLVIFPLLGAVSFADESSATRSRSGLDEILFQLESGNFEPLERANGTRTPWLLYTALHAAVMHQLGAKSAELQVQIASRIAAIPGHAKYLGDKIDKLSGEFSTTRERGEMIYWMGHVRSKEVLEELGRLLFDSKLPEAALSIDQLDLNLSIQANDGMAAESLHRFLGKDSPLKEAPGLLSNGVEQMQQWWNSAAGQAYRAAFNPRELAVDAPKVPASAKELKGNR
jgi:hypothetical protein